MPTRNIATPGCEVVALGACALDVTSVDATVPEPQVLGLLASGLLGLVRTRRRRPRR